MVHMVAERDTDSVAPTPTPQHPHHSQHHHLSLHEIRALQVSDDCIPFHRPINYTERRYPNKFLAETTYFIFINQVSNG